MTQAVDQITSDNALAADMTTLNPKWHSLAIVQEAWIEARLSDVDPRRVGLIVGGSNVQQRELTQIHESYRDRELFLRPTYALSFMDSDICGVCSAQFGIRGPANTVGGASASGQLAIITSKWAVSCIEYCLAEHKRAAKFFCQMASE